MDTRTVPTAEGYDRWATTYDSDGNPMVAADDRLVEALLDQDFKGLAVCDLGCGTGRNSLRLAARGARVTGVDSSEGMLGKARLKAALTKLPINFLRHDVEKKLPFPDGTFDVVVSTLVLEHIKDLEAFFKEASRLCRPGGMVFMTGMHPAMLLRGKQAAFKDAATGEKILPEGYPHRIPDFVNAALAAKLTLVGLHEFAGDEELAKTHPRAADYVGWPMVVALVLKTPDPKFL